MAPVKVNWLEQDTRSGMRGVCRGELINVVADNGQFYGIVTEENRIKAVELRMLRIDSTQAQN